MNGQLQKLIAGDLDAHSAREALQDLSQKPNADLLVECVQTLKKHQRPFHLKIPNGAMDVCGTGGDKRALGQSSFNISTAVAFVLAACDIPIIKHSNRAASSVSGSLDVLGALGVRVDLDEEVAQKRIDNLGLLFLDASYYYPTLKGLAPIRKSLGYPTIFNLAGPLANPADVSCQMVGCYGYQEAEIMAQALQKMGQNNFAVLHGEDGLDEMTPAGKTYIFKPEGVSHITPDDFGLNRFDSKLLKGGDSAHNARIICDIFDGQKGLYYDVVMMNAAYAVFLHGEEDYFTALMKVDIGILTGQAKRILLEMRA